MSNVGSPVASTDATNKVYVDNAVAAGPRAGYATIHGTSIFQTNIPGLAVQRATGYPAGLFCVTLPAGYIARGTTGSVQQNAGGNGVAGILVGSSSYNAACMQQGFPLGVYTYNTAGTLVDFSFTILVPR